MQPMLRQRGHQIGAHFLGPKIVAAGNVGILNRGRFLGLKSCPFSCLFVARYSRPERLAGKGWRKAMAAWQLFNFAELTARHRGKPLLRINLDETRIGLHFSAPRGLQARAVSRRAQKAKARRRKTVVQNVPLGKKRAGFTHVAMICDDTSLQPRLPQILLGNEAIFPVATLDALRPTLPPNVRLWRRRSGWVTKDLLRDIIRELAIALGELTATHTVVLLLDTASMHICPRAIGMAARHGICMQYIPAKMTWLLQPLDTHVFARYKLHLV